MSSPITLEQVESLVAQLSPANRLKLVARVCEQLSTVSPGHEPSSPEDPLARWADWIKECDEVAELSEGNFDAVADLRRIRDEDD